MMFKESFKYYKSKKNHPNLDKVFDLYTSELLMNSRIRQLSIISTVDPCELFGLNVPQTWKVYELVERPGLIFIKNPFTGFGQRYWIIRCLRDYSKKPNKTNIDNLNIVPQNEEFWNLAQYNEKILKNLRWATLGYHHNWDTKVYDEKLKGEFPSDLAHMTKYIADILGYPYFKAEAAIVNYYHMDSTLSGHTDHSEQNLNAPLFSYSFGQSAVFLIGGKTIEDEPIPILLRSGDILIMSKDSRLAYHGVPKILPADIPCWKYIDVNKKQEDDQICDCGDEKVWKPFGDYITHSRININVRQVLNTDQNVLNAEFKSN